MFQSRDVFVTLLFDDADGQACRYKRSELERVLMLRAAKELRQAAAIASGDVQAVLETKGVKKSQAYELTAAARQKEKAKQQAAALRLYSEGVSVSEIAKRLGKPRATVSRWSHQQAF